MASHLKIEAKLLPKSIGIIILIDPYLWLYMDKLFGQTTLRGYFDPEIS